ncbi:MAG TPA: ATP-binding protein [Vicinamibacterales bacterium]
MKLLRADLSIAQRLALGFGVVLAIAAGVTAFVFDRHERSVEAQRAYVEAIAPRRDRAVDVEEAMLSLAIVVRSYLIQPEATRLERVREARQALVDAARDLEMAAQDAGTAGAEYRVRQLTDEYVARVDETVAAVETERVAGLERGMIAAREALAAALRNVLREQQAATVSAFDRMASSRESVRRALLAASVLMVGCALVLGYATAQSIARPLRRLVRAAHALEDDDWRPALALAKQQPAPSHRPRDEVQVLANALGAAATALESRAQRLRTDGELASIAASTLDRRQLAEGVLRIMAAYVRAETGVIYGRRRDSDLLEPLARHAVGHADLVRVGDGLPGQAAADGRLHVIREIPPDAPFAVRLGYDQAPPRAVAAVPLAFRNEVQGVAILGSLRDFDAEAIAFLEAAGRQVGIALHNAGGHEEVERLLEELRESNQQLQAQNEEIQAQNEEIQAQNEEMQVQQEELQQRARELETYSADLRRHAAKLAEADARKNEFLGLLAHELRNPLAPMTVSLLILQQSEPGSERARRAQAVIERQVRHLSRLIDDLLDTTRISHGKIQIAREPLEFVEVVRSCIEDQQATIAEKSLQLTVEMPGHGIWVDGDRTRLCQVLNNLLSNATKFTDPGGRVAVTLREDGGEAVLEVADTGAGIDPALLPAMFQPFTQGTTSLDRENGGLGLGLALVKALVELHDGSVEGHSDGPGRGARFIVRLPTRAPVEPGERAAAEAVDTRRYRILLIEDNRDAALSLAEALELQGHHVEVAHTGRDGIEKASALVPDLVLCDIGLPVVDGYEVARRLRADERLRSTLLVAVSGYAAAQDRARAQEAGFDHHVAKPLTAELFAGILRQLGRRRLEQSS